MRGYLASLKLINEGPESRAKDIIVKQYEQIREKWKEVDI